MENQKRPFVFGGLRNNFFAGVAVILPAIVTIIIIRFLITRLDPFVLNPIVEAISPLLPPVLDKIIFQYLVKGVVFLTVLLIMVFLIVLVGFTTRIILIRRFFSFWEGLLFKIPLIGKIYLGIKEISNAFLGKGRAVFRSVVLIEYPRKGIRSIGFVTGRAGGEIRSKAGEEMLNVFVPTTPNPTSGVFLLIPEKDVVYLDMSVEQGMKLVISGGAVAPRYEQAELKERQSTGNLMP